MTSLIEDDPLAPGDVVWVPFPHVEDNRLRPRPVLIVASGIGGRMALCWGLMITSAANATWPDDILIPDHVATGLPIPSRVRVGKIATLDAASATRLGRLADGPWCQVREGLSATLGLDHRAR